MMRIGRFAASTLVGALLLACAGSGASTAQTGQVCGNATGEHGGYFWTFFRDGGSGCMTLESGGRFGVAWSLGPNGNLIVGKGWATGSTGRRVGYNAGSFDPGANGYLALYGWTTDPLVEYYVVDSWGDYTPPGDARQLGTVDSDGGTYRIYRTRRVDQPSIAGTATFDQYWSVRTARRPTGTDHVVTFANHVEAWRGAGMPLGTMGYQVMAAEGYGSDGRADVTVWQD